MNRVRHPCLLGLFGEESEDRNARSSRRRPRHAADRQATSTEARSDQLVHVTIEGCYVHGIQAERQSCGAIAAGTGNGMQWIGKLFLQKHGVTRLYMSRLKDAMFMVYKLNVNRAERSLQERETKQVQIDLKKNKWGHFLARCHTYTQHRFLRSGEAYCDKGLELLFKHAISMPPARRQNACLHTVVT